MKQKNLSAGSTGGSWSLLPNWRRYFAMLGSSAFASLLCWACLVSSSLAEVSASDVAPGVRVERLLDAPIISPETHPLVGSNIAGPSLIRAPGWLDQPLGRYYLYFADHKGAHIRLAYADQLIGPWRQYEEGTLQLEESGFLVASPPSTERQVK